MYNDLLLDRLVATHDHEADERIEALITEIEELDNLLSPEAQQLIRDLRPHIVTDDVYEEMDEQATFGEKVSDTIASFAGSWPFIIMFLLVMAGWVVMNLAMGKHSFDRYPFILLNLMLSTLAALQAPVILMAQNRQADKDRAMAQNDFQVNLKNELEIADLHRKIDALTNAMTMQTQLVNALVAARRQELSATVKAIENARRTDGVGNQFLS